jgi:hypothetical protein
MEIRERIIPALLGVVVGAVGITAIGFSAMGWKLPSTAEHLASTRAEEAIVNVLTPICVERFQQQANYGAELAKLKEASSWTRYEMIEKAGWATVPGTDETHSAVARACAAKIGELS